MHLWCVPTCWVHKCEYTFRNPVINNDKESWNCNYRLSYEQWLRNLSFLLEKNIFFKWSIIDAAHIVSKILCVTIIWIRKFDSFLVLIVDRSSRTYFSNASLATSAMTNYQWGETFCARMEVISMIKPKVIFCVE